MPGASTNVNVIAFEVLQAMAYGRKVELVLKTGASMKGVPVRIVEDKARKSEATRGGTERSHLIVQLDRAGASVDLERVREVNPAL